MDFESDLDPVNQIEEANTEPSSQNSIEEKQLYCICQTPFDNKRFYVGCDLCNKWFHGDCVGVSEVDAETIDEFVCDDCKLQVKDVHVDKICCLCKQQYESSKLYIDCDTCHQFFHSDCIGVCEDEVHNLTTFKCLCCSPQSNNPDLEHQPPEDSQSHPDNDPFQEHGSTDVVQNHVNGERSKKVSKFKPSVGFCGYTCEYCSLPFAIDTYRKQHQIFCKNRQSNLKKMAPDKRKDKDIRSKVSKRSVFGGRSSQNLDQEKILISTDTNSKIKHQSTSKSLKKHCCKKCGQRFRKLSNLKRHRLCHINENICSVDMLNKCGECDKTFSRRDALKRHLLIHTGEKPCICDLCDESFRHQHLLNRHKMTHHNDIDLVCRQCNQVFESSDLLNEHSRQHARKQAYICDQCGEQFPLLDDLHSHKVAHSLDERSTVCNQCGKMYSSYANLKRHQKMHSVQYSYECNQCEKVFLSLDKLNAHKQIHIRREGTSICEICSKSYSSYTNLRRHQKIHHEGKFDSNHQDKRRVLSSDGSNRLYPTNTGNEKCHICEDCGAQFSTLDNLNEHSETHANDDQPHKCNQCKKSYSTYTDLSMHKKTCQIDNHGNGDVIGSNQDGHNGIQNNKKSKLYVCNYCEKSFGSSASLYRHKHTHTGRKRFSCECGKVFSQRGNLKRHKLIHSRDKPYICDQCGRTFNRSDHLHAHQKNHKQDAKHKCSQCGEGFPSVDDLNLHSRTHTEDVRPNILNTDVKPSRKMRIKTTFRSSETTDHVCNYCGKILSSLANLKRHEKIHSGKRPFACGHCNLKFRFSTSLRRHERLHFSEEPHKCNQCGKGYSTIIDLNAHEKTHHSMTTYKCDSCEEQFSSLADLIAHQPSHGNVEGPYVCNYCGKGYSSKGNLARHKKKNPDHQFNTSIHNERSISSSDDVVPHSQLKTANKWPFICNQCGKKYSSLGNLARHKKTHTNEESNEFHHDWDVLSPTTDASSQSQPKNNSEGSFVCNQCGKKYSSLGNLGRHKKTHSNEASNKFHHDWDVLSPTTDAPSKSQPKNNNEGSFVCNQCGKKYSSLGNLARHKKTHSNEASNKFHHDWDVLSPTTDAPSKSQPKNNNEGSFVCNQCGKKYSSLGNLGRHKKTHNNEASNEFHHDWDVLSPTADSSLQSQPKNNSEGTYVCDQCGKKYSSLGNLGRHKKTHTSKQSDVHEWDMFSSSEEAASHDQARNSNEWPIICNQCGKTYSSLGNLARHKKTHTNEQSDGYDKNDFSFSSSVSLDTPSQNENQNDSSHSCNICGKAYSCYGNLSRHLKAHLAKQSNQHEHESKPLSPPSVIASDNQDDARIDKRITCEKCGKEYSSYGNLTRHTKIHHREELLFSSSRDVDLHDQSLDEDVKSHVCNFCGQRYIFLGNLIRHQNSQHEEELYLLSKEEKEKPTHCDQCGKQFSSYENLRRHQKNHGEKKHSFDCDQCIRTFFSQDILNAHKEIHSRVGMTNVCRHCGKGYSSNTNLRRHERTHHHRTSRGEIDQEDTVNTQSSGDLPVTTLENKKMRLMDVPTSNSNFTGVYRCRECGKRLCSLHSLKRHQRVHTGEKPFSCDHCSKRFRFANGLKRHKSMQVCKGPFVCDLCDERFLIIDDLDVHKQSHTIRKESSDSDNCTKDSSASKLRRKKPQSDGERIECDECGKYFGSFANLKRHERIHTGEKPFVCDECGKAFNAQTNLNRHKKIHVREEMMDS